MSGPWAKPGEPDAVYADTNGDGRFDVAAFDRDHGVHIDTCSREFAADADGVRHSDDPLALAGAHLEGPHLYRRHRAVLTGSLTAALLATVILRIRNRVYRRIRRLTRARMVWRSRVHKSDQ
jgi:hypothetical protein